MAALLAVPAGVPGHIGLAGGVTPEDVDAVSVRTATRYSRRMIHFTGLVPLAAATVRQG